MVSRQQLRLYEPVPALLKIATVVDLRFAMRMGRVSHPSTAKSLGCALFHLADHRVQLQGRHGCYCVTACGFVLVVAVS